MTSLLATCRNVLLQSLDVESRGCAAHSIGPHLLARAWMEVVSKLSVRKVPQYTSKLPIAQSAGHVHAYRYCEHATPHSLR